ncbi:MAG: IS66 family transposase [Arenicella sp.]
MKCHDDNLLEINLKLMAQVATLEQQNQRLERRMLQSEQAYSHLLDQVKQMNRHRFGQRFERYIDPDNPQVSLFDRSEAPISQSSLDLGDDSSAGDKTVVNLEKARKKKQSRKPFAEGLPRKEVIIKVDDDLRTCACGCQKKLLSYDRHERLNYQPPVFEVLVELREKLVCPNGCSAQVAVADKPKHILPKSKLAESIMAYIIVSKLDDRQPYYHIEKQFAQRAGFHLSRQTMARTIIELIRPLQPLYNLFKDGVIGDDIGALDATTFQVLREPGRSAKTKSYAYCFRGWTKDRPVIVYEYNAHQHKAFVRDWYEGFSGVLHCDADPFFETLFSQKNISPSYCNAHARRYFEKIAKATKNKGLADQAMSFYKRLYDIERYAKNEFMTSEQRQQLRLEHSKPVLGGYKAWLDEHYASVLPKSSLGKAFSYSLKHWDGLCEFINDGRLEADNNLTEQEIKPFVIA